MMKRRMLVVRGLAAVMALLMCLCGAGTTLAFQYDGIVNDVLNVSSSKVINVDDEAIDTVYYDTPYGTDYYNAQSALALELDVASEIIQQYEEGVVLLKNDNDALPLSKDTGITIFGNASVHGNSSDSGIGSIEAVTFVSAMEDEFDNLNLTLVDNLYADMSSSTGTQVVEADIEDVKAYESTWQTDYNDAAVVVLTRIKTGEDADVAFYDDDGNHFLGLQKNEEALMSYLRDEKAAGVFDKIIVILNTDYMMEVDWLDEYGVDACLLCGSAGSVGFTGLGRILSGDVSPSGKLADTMAANSLSAPAISNANENTGVWTNLDEMMDICTDNENNGKYIDEYVVYAEGIYVGYKYYETRYEDTVMGTGNADSTVGSSTDDAWNYADEMSYTFGYGLSYTTFEQTLDSVRYDAASDNYYVTVTVTNTGDVSGKDVVEVYAQTPYGEYEKENGVEKSAVILVSFDKTQELAPGESETLEIAVERYFLASYDSNQAEGYILSAGDYYLAIGSDAHDALNNILAVKGYTVSDGMTAEGDTQKVYTWNQAELDTESYAVSSVTGEEVTNQFDNADLSYYGIDFTYLSRSDWEGTFPTETAELTATEQIMEDIDDDWYEEPEDAPEVDDFTQGADNGLSFIDMRLVDIDDDEKWNEYIDQFTIEEMASLLNDSRGTSSVDSQGVPSQVRNDDSITGRPLLSTGETTLTWPSECTTSRTWNPERCTNRGLMKGYEGAFCGISEWWYGGGDIHRTPFGGRYGQYFSEDGNFSYLVGLYESEAMQSVGVNYCIKHFVLNDQETGRQSYATFISEQTLREEYLRAFEGALKEGGAMSVMAAFNRIGVIGCAFNENLLTNVLRNEWGFEGHVTPDGFSLTSFMVHYEEMLAAGVNYFCLDGGNTSSAIVEAINNGDGYMLQCLREATKRNIYVAVNSVAANGINSSSIIVTVVPAWKTAMFIADIVFGAGFIVCTCMYIVMVARKKKTVGGLENEK